MIVPAFLILTGMWRAALITPGGELPFQVLIDTVNSHYTFTVINGDEHMLLDDVKITGDSMLISFPVYESELRLKRIASNELKGEFINLTRTTYSRIPLEIKAGTFPRFFSSQEKKNVSVNGKWSVVFDPGTADSSYAVGQFQQQANNNVTGTFLTSSGDYRYLDGIISGDSLLLSTFNGVFIYLVKARISGNNLSGTFYSGIHRQIPISGFRDEKAKLPDADKLTTIKVDSAGFSFRFPDTDSLIVSLEDERFRNKPVLIQVMGSWCPNCLDESLFLGPFYDKNRHRGFEIVGLSFEKTADFKRAAANVNRFKKRLNINYPVLVANHRDKLKETMPAIENFIGFPTTIFLDKKHKVRKVHAGFLGAATGIEYEQFMKEFTDFAELLLNE
jgi:thiol-disulfide isomerase/thioredoxin